VSARRPAPRSPGTRLAEVVTHPLRAAPTRVGTTLRRKRESDSLDGTPPRAWGRQSDQEPAPGICRYTPTRVGTTQPAQMQLGPQSGAPARAWGRRRGMAGVVSKWRYTPTREETTPRGQPCLARPAVHPHARGDDDA